MELGHALLAGAVLSGAVSIAAMLAPGGRRVAHGAFLAAWAFLAGALVLMLASFLLGDLRIAYVWAHTRVDYPWYYRMAGLWGGQEGTVVMWAFALATLLLVEKRRALGGVRRPDLARCDALHGVVHLVVLGLTTALAGFLLADGAFAATEASLLASPATRDGRGLVEVLVTPLMVIHPPIQFAAYALMAMPAALALGGLATAAPTRAWAGAALQWGRVAWAFATVGLGLGALWAYYVLSFGGYWAWDPVETSNLLPWLALTAFMHAGKYADRFDDYRLAAPLLAVAALWLTFFSTFATRSGLWISVHAFTDPTNKFDPDAASRLLGIMEAHLPTRFFVGLLAVLALLAAAVLVRRYAAGVRGGPLFARAYVALVALLAGWAAAAPTSFVGALFEAGRAVAFGQAPAGAGLLAGLLLGLPVVWLYVEQDDPTAGGARDWSRRLMYAAVLVFSVGLAVAFLLNLQVVNGFDRGVFDVRAPFVAVPLVLVLTVMLAHTVVGRGRALALAGAGLAAGLVGAWAMGEMWVVGLSVPVLAVALLASVAKLAHVNRGATGALRVAGALLLLAALLGMVMWSNPPSRLGPFRPGVGTGVLFFGLSALGLLGAVAALRGVAPRLAVAGAVGATLAAGYGVGALLALVALALVLRERRAFGAAALLPQAPPALRQTGIYLIHFAVAAGLLGYAASTYASEKHGYVELEVGATSSFFEGAVTVGEPAGTAEAPLVPIVVTHAGRDTPADLAFAWKGRPLDHYAQDLHVARGLFKDVYAAGFGLTFADGTSVKTLEPTRPYDPSEITAVTFELSVLPLMTLVWAGLWIMTLGMTLIVTAGAMEGRNIEARPVVGRLQVRRSGREAGPGSSESPVPASGMRRLREQ